MSDELIRAAKAEDLTALAVLVDAGHDINERGRDGWSALDVASRWNRSKSVSFLLEHGASVNKDGDGGQRVLALADGKPIAHLLFQYGASGRSGSKWLLREDEDTRNIVRDEIPKTPVKSDDIYSVLGALFLSDLFVWSGACIEHMTTTSLTFSETPITDKDEQLTYYFRYPWRHYWQRSAGLVEDFVDVNALSSPLVRHTALPDYIQFNNEELEVGVKLRDAAFRVSCPGFNNDLSLALLYVEWYGSPKAASGILTLFDKLGGSWDMVRFHERWCA